MRPALALPVLVAALPAFALTAEPLPPPPPADPGWALLERVEIREVERDGQWAVEKDFDHVLAARNGTELTLTGYAIPLSPGEVITHLILVSDPADCPFCGGGYGPALEVTLDLGLPYMPEFSRLTVTGRLVLVPDEDTMQAYRLENARAAPAP